MKPETVNSKGEIYLDSSALTSKSWDLGMEACPADVSNIVRLTGFLGCLGLGFLGLGFKVQG